MSAKYRFTRYVPFGTARLYCSSGAVLESHRSVRNNVSSTVPAIAFTVLVTSSLFDSALSFAVSRSTYVPAALKLAVVSTALALPNVTVPGPLTFDQVVVSRSEERRVGKESRSRWLPYH